MLNDNHPALKPTVLIDAVPGLRWRQVAHSLARSQPRGTSVALAVGVAVAAGGGIGPWVSNPTQARADSGDPPSATCAWAGAPIHQRG